jgi:imidazolonepropionase
VRIKTSFLGAHAVPPEYKGRADAYIDDVCLPALEAAHAAGLADAVDGFCEGIAFSPAQIARVFDRARALGIPVKLHAEQLSNLGGTQLAARYGALSADHLEYANEDDAGHGRFRHVAVFCPAPSTLCAKPWRRQSTRFASMACRWRLPPIAIPALRP